jgi:transposase
MSKTSQCPPEERSQIWQVKAGLKPVHHSPQLPVVFMPEKTSSSEAVQGCLGLDIAKATFEACLLRGERCYCCGFDNTPEGVRKLQLWTEKLTGGPVPAVLESTGRYGDLAATLLFEAGYPVSVVNPRWIKDHGRSKGQRNKTDRSDAKAIADYARSHEKDLDSWSPAPAERVILRTLLHRIRELETMRQGELNRREALPDSSPLHGSLDRLTHALEEEIALLEKNLHEHILAHPQLQQDCERLETVPGIGAKSARWLVAELSHSFPNCRAAAAWVGVTPRIHDSGSSVHKRPGIGPQGNQPLRSLLYLPAVVARTKNPTLKAFADRLEAQGKLSKKAIILAVMHKLVRIAFALLKNQSTYQPNHVPEAFDSLQKQHI